MKSRLAFSFFVCSLLLFDSSDALLLRGKHKRWTAAQLRDYRAANPIKTHKTHQFFLPDYPADPLTIYLPIGTPAQIFMLNLATASVQAWILGTAYSGLIMENCPYEPAQSTTSRPNGGSWYARDDQTDLMGAAYIDVFDVSQIDSGLVFNQSFGVVDSSWSNDEETFDVHFPVDGVLALGWNVNEVPTTADANSSLIHNILDNAKDITKDNRFYTLWLENPASKQKETTQSFDWEVDFGFTNEDKCEQDFFTTPLHFFSNNTGGIFYLDLFRFGPDLHAELGDESVMVDTGFPIILMPYSTGTAVWATINPTFNYYVGFWTVDCQVAVNLPPLEFFPSSSVLFSVPATTYIKNEQDKAFQRSFSPQQVQSRGKGRNE
ncbi:hypothetical protein M3Y99_00459400 [Aphelenchoides fujianensis]|nr:hypothetical protein M3Y99_00459400 [Aphelenchoides fujianensis]